MKTRKYLIEMREKKQISQQIVADRIGISRQYYSAIEMGTRQKNMDITLISALAKIFEVSLECIIERENAWKCDTKRIQEEKEILSDTET